MRCNIQLHNQDCMEAMKQMPDKAFDLAIVDPPYGIGEDGKSNNSRDGKKNGAIIYSTKYTPKTWDSKPFPRSFFVELFRVSKNWILWGRNIMRIIYQRRIRRVVIFSGTKI